MYIEFCWRCSQEDEGAEEIHYPIVLVKKEEDDYSDNFVHLGHFFLNIDNVENASKVLKIINFYKKESCFISVLALKLGNDTQRLALLEGDRIKFRNVFSEEKEFVDEISLELFLRIVKSWREYLISGNKNVVIIEH